MVEAGKDKKDRFTRGSYIALREIEHRERQEERRKLQELNDADENYLPVFLN